MQADYHVHTALCGHAEGEMAEYVDAARARGVPEICFTDHMPAPDGYDPRHRMRPDQYPLYRQAGADLRRSITAPTVLFGIEADYYPGCEAYLGRWLKEEAFDLVIGSIHYIRNWDFENPAESAVWNTVDVTETWREYFRLLGRLADTGFYDVVGHLDITKKFKHIPPENNVADMAARALDRIAAAGMAIELNTSGLRRAVEEIYPSLHILKMARERDIPICFGSDAHLPDEIAYAFDQALDLARQAGYTHTARYRRRRRDLVPLP